MHTAKDRGSAGSTPAEGTPAWWNWHTHCLQVAGFPGSNPGAGMQVCRNGRRGCFKYSFMWVQIPPPVLYGTLTANNLDDTVNIKPIKRPEYCRIA